MTAVVAALVALGVPQLSLIENPRYICLNDIKEFIEDSGNKSFCEQAGEAQCFDVYEASTGESAFLHTTSDSCDCYCQNFADLNFSKQVLKLNSSPEKAKLPKSSILMMDSKEYPWDFNTPNNRESAFCLSAADVRAFLTSLASVDTIPRKLAAMAMPLTVVARMEDPLLSSQFLWKQPVPKDFQLQNGWITEGSDMDHLATGLQPAGSMSIFFTTATRPNTYIVQGDVAKSAATPFKAGAAINSVEINTDASSGIPPLTKCRSYFGLTIEAMFVAPDYLPGNAQFCTPDFFFDLTACETDAFRCQDAENVYKQCTSCIEDIEDVVKPCNIYEDTVCSARPTVSSDGASRTDAPSLKKPVSFLIIIVLIIVGIFVFMFGFYFIQKYAKKRERRRSDYTSLNDRNQSEIRQTKFDRLITNTTAPPKYF